MSGAPALIEIRGATVYREQTRVFDALDLEIGQDENVVILGPNGSGKTTLLKLITREIYPVVRPGSRVRILGRERFHIDELRARLGIVSHDLQLEFLAHFYPGAKRGREVVLSGLCNAIGLHAIATDFDDELRAQAEALMARLAITGLADTPFANMSTGQQRRFLLARALINRPANLILDEPGAGLDLPASFEMQRLLRGLMREGTRVVLVTHHVNEIPPGIERVVLLREGRVFADGPRERVLTEDTLSALYDTPVRLVRADGEILALPGQGSSRAQLP